MIENVIAKAMLQTTELVEKLAVYNQEPAIFYQQAVHDQDRLWNGMQYPRIEYIVDWQYNPERKSNGTMMVNLFCTNECEPPEDIELIIVNKLSNLFVTEDSDTYCLLWNRSDSFDVSGNEPQIYGVTIMFDVIAFPVATTSTPDPIASINTYTKSLFPNAKIIGIDDMPEILRPNDDMPVIYYRINNVSSAMRNQYAVAWMIASIVGHFIAPSTHTRLSLLKTITESLALDGEIVMDDNSPMMLQNPLLYTMSNNSVTLGQLTVTGRYGVLRHEETSPMMENINFGRKE